MADPRARVLRALVTGACVIIRLYRMISWPEILGSKPRMTSEQNGPFP